MKIQIRATYIYEVDVNTESLRVQEYESTDELVEDLAVYNMSPGLPVIGYRDVKVRDTYLDEHSYKILGNDRMD